ncbi:hypothetical protein AB4124_25815 [Paenibacillus sp. 2KB_20]|uniref:hypothetical protein n=1 Tax=Paenibacillus sp. 2KB_20 TaxID=3232977 RepID=UPI003F984186
MTQVIWVLEIDDLRDNRLELFFDRCEKVSPLTMDEVKSAVIPSSWQGAFPVIHNENRIIV